MIKEEIQLRYFNRMTKQITEEKQNDNDFYLVNQGINTAIAQDYSTSHISSS